MKTKLLFATTVLLLSLVFPKGVLSQKAAKKTHYAQLQLQNGDVVLGEMLEVSLDSVTLLVEEEERHFAKRTVKNYSFGETIDFVNRNTFDDVVSFLPSAKPLGDQPSYFKNYNIFFNQINFGLASYLELAVGFELISILNGGYPTMFVAPKVMHSWGNIHIAASNYVFVAPNNGVGMVLVPAVTIGDKTHFTIGGVLPYDFDGSYEAFVYANATLPLGHKFAFSLSAISSAFEVNIIDYGVTYKTTKGQVWDFNIVSLGASGVAPLISLAIPLDPRS